MYLLVDAPRNMNVTIVCTFYVSISSGQQNLIKTYQNEAGKGRLISKCPFGVKTSSKKPTKIFPGFLP